MQLTNVGANVVDLSGLDSPYLQRDGTITPVTRLKGGPKSTNLKMGIYMTFSYCIAWSLLMMTSWLCRPVARRRTHAVHEHLATDLKYI